MIRQYELIERIRAYNPDADELLINRAYVYAMIQHGNQVRASGDPYFSHPLEVAGILADIRLDSASIITALLHDTVEDTDATLGDIRRMFGSEVARLVDGVTKLSRIESQSTRTRQAENLRKLVLAMSQDIRVLLVKLADRLHNMRTLNFVSGEEKRRRIAAETLDIYVPLAERIGMQHWKEDLEDRAFAVLQPEARRNIVQRLELLDRERGGQVGRIIGALSQVLDDAGLEAEVTGRRKGPHSIHIKMQRKDVSLEQVSDIMAFRVVVDGGSWPRDRPTMTLLVDRHREGQSVAVVANDEHGPGRDVSSRDQTVQVDQREPLLHGEPQAAVVRVLRVFTTVAIAQKIVGPEGIVVRAVGRRRD